MHCIALFFSTEIFHYCSCVVSCLYCAVFILSYILCCSPRIAFYKSTLDPEKHNTAFIVPMCRYFRSHFARGPWTQLEALSQTPVIGLRLPWWPVPTHPQLATPSTDNRTLRTRDSSARFRWIRSVHTFRYQYRSVQKTLWT